MQEPGDFEASQTGMDRDSYVLIGLITAIDPLQSSHRAKLKPTAGADDLKPFPNNKRGHAFYTCSRGKV